MPSSGVWALAFSAIAEKKKALQLDMLGWEGAQIGVPNDGCSWWHHVDPELTLQVVSF